MRSGKVRKWELVRSQGKRRYAVTRGMLGLGIPLLLCWAMWRFGFAHILQTENIYAVLGELVVFVPGIFYFGFRFGSRIWDVQAKRYSDATAQPQK